MNLARDPLGGLLLKFALPLIANLLVGALYGILNSIYVARIPGLGMTAVSAVSAAFPITLIAVAMGQLIGMGAAALISAALGAGRRAEAKALLGQAILASGALALVAVVAGWLLTDPLLRLLGTPDSVLTNARGYAQVLLAGFAFQVPAIALNSTLRAQSRPQAALYGSLASSLVNAALAPLFIFALGWGLEGAAWAAVAAQAAFLAYTAWLLQNARSNLRITREGLRPRPDLIAAIARSGLPMALMQVLTIAVIIAANRGIGTVSSEPWALGVVGIVYTFSMLFSYPVIGLAQAAQSLWSWNMGAREYARVERLLRLAFALAFGFGLAVSLLALAFPGEIVRILGASGAEATAAAERGLRLFMPSFGLFCLLAVELHYFQAIGRVKEPAFLLLAKYALLIVFFAVLPGSLGFEGVFLSGPASDLLAWTLGLLLILPAYRRLALLKERVKSGTGAGTRA